MTPAFDAERELRQHGAALRTLALALLGDAHAADDAVQETWLRALEQPPVHASSPGGWLATVLRRLASRARRGELRRRRREAESARAGHLPAADAQAVREEMLRAVVDAVLSLEAPYRDVIWQRYLEERTPAAIARASGEPIATVKSRLQRGLAQLRQRLDERRGGSDWRAGLAAAFHLAAVPAVLTTGAVLMGTTAKVAGAAGLVAAVSLWWVLAQQDSTAAPITSSTSPTAMALAAVPEPAAPERANEQDALAAGELQRQLAPEPDLGPTANLRVVRYGSNAPVAAASVHYQSDFDWTRLPASLREELQQLAATDTEALLQRIGRQGTTDAEGGCRVAVGKSGTRVCARAGDQYGEHWINPDAKTPHVLQLRTDRTLSVRVLGALGAPAANVAIEIERESSGGWSTESSKTDQEGRWTRRHIQEFAGDEPACLAHVVAVAPGVRAAARIDLVAPPAEVVLHLPPCGAVTVHVRDADGKPVDPGFLVDAYDSVHLAAVDRLPDDQQTWRLLNRVGRKAAVSANGDAVFPHVGFDRRLIVGGSWASDPVIAEGPTHARPHVEVTVQEAADGVLFVGTLLDDEGRPFANREFMLSCRGSGSLSSRIARTDARGGMRCKLGFPGDEACVVTLGTPPTQREGRLAIELPPRPVQPGVHDLGEVRLAALPLLIGGKLVPEPGVDLKAMPMFYVERRQGEGWEKQINLHPEWGDGGHFTMHSAIPAGVPLRLLIGEGAFLPIEPIECTSGDSAMEIPLRAAGEARAEFLVDAEVPLNQLRFFFRRTDATAPTDFVQLLLRWTTSGGASLEPDGRVRRRWAGLIPGIYELCVECAGTTEPLVRVPDIRVAAGACTDGRLQGIDLRGRIRGIEIRAVDAAGTPIRDEGAFAVLRRTSDEPWARWTGINFGQGVAKLAGTPAVDVWVLAPGFEMASIDAVAESRVIALRPAAKTKLQIELSTPLPTGWSIRLELRPMLDLPRAAMIQLDTGRGMQVENFLVEHVHVAADGSAEVPVRWPGKYTVIGHIDVGGGGRADRDIAPRTITLPAEGTLTLRVSRPERAR